MSVGTCNVDAYHVEIDTVNTISYRSVRVK